MTQLQSFLCRLCRPPEKIHRESSATPCHTPPPEKANLQSFPLERTSQNGLSNILGHSDYCTAVVDPDMIDHGQFGIDGSGIDAYPAHGLGSRLTGLTTASSHRKGPFCQSFIAPLGDFGSTLLLFEGRVPQFQIHNPTGDNPKLTMIRVSSNGGQGKT